MVMLGGTLYVYVVWLELVELLSWRRNGSNDMQETAGRQDRLGTQKLGRAETNGRYNPGVLFVVVLRKMLAQLPPSRRSPSTDGPSALTAEDREREIFK
jgi:hypothetical protein